ncbi:MAG: hypothetical protein R3C12_08210 [Planctomycetaceae bacterium]|nr:hypothetical protein [Planctomycetaceae bacterium]
MSAGAGRLLAAIAFFWGLVPGQFPEGQKVRAADQPTLPEQQLDSAGKDDFDVYQGAIPVRVFSFEQDEDLDYDSQPDDWTRRRGLEFRQYVRAEIDYRHASHEKRSLRIDANGSGAAYYSPPIPIDAFHSYVMRASVLTRGLQHDAALVSFSFLNHRKQRVERLLMPPVSGTHKSWANLKIPPVTPSSEVKFVVVGCHLVHSEEMDLSGSAWFDEIIIAKLPSLSLASNFETHFRKSDSDITIHSHATGLDDSHQGASFQYNLQLVVEDVYGRTIDQTVRELKPAPSTEATARSGKQTDQTVWHLPVYPPGYYRVHASLLRNDSTVVRKSTAFAVLNLVEKSPSVGEFGWNLSGAHHHIDYPDLLAIAQQSGINWIKIPVWQDAYSHNPAAVGQFLTELRNQSINPIGMFADPPREIRQKYAPDWGGISELFVSPPIVWREAANQVMALYSPTVTRWQLGDDNDSSFVGMPELHRTMDEIRKELQRIGQIRQLGVRWNVGSAVQRNPALTRNFLTVIFDEHETLESVSRSVGEIQQAGYEAWVLVKASKPDLRDDPHVRANDLVRRMILSKQTGCDLIFAYNVFDPEYGLLEPDGSPSELFLPWRTVSLALNHSQYAGSIQLPGRSQNHVFLREHDAVLVLWNDEPIEEDIYLGDEVIQHTVWGDKRRLWGDARTGRQKFTVTSVPMILTGCSKELMDWRMGVRFEKGRISSSLAEQEDTLIVKNAFPWTVQGTVQILPEYAWQITPSHIPLVAQGDQEVALPFGIKLPSRTNLGKQTLEIEFNLGGAGISHPFRVYRDYLVGLGDVRMEIVLTPTDEGGVLVEQIVTNQTETTEVIDMRCHLLIRGRRRQTRNIDGLASGQSRKAVYLIPDFENLEAKDLWLRAEQKNGRRILNDVIDEEQFYKLLERNTTPKESASNN